MSKERSKSVLRKLKAPISVQIEVTTNCDANCIYCYNHWRHNAIQNYNLNVEQIPTIVAELQKNDVLSVTITGGEPLVNEKTTLKLIQKLEKAQIKYSLNSNLMRMRKDLAVNLKNLGLNSILTSLSSFNPKTHDFISGRVGNFNKVIKGIKTAQDAGLSVTVNMVLTKFNEKDVYQTAEFLHGLGIQHFTVTKASPSLGIKKQFYDNFKVNRDSLLNAMNDLLQAKNDFHLGIDILECYPLCFFPNDSKYAVFTSHRCMAGISTCTISANGDVRPCSHANLVYGNIFKEQLTDIWHKMQNWQDGQFIPTECRNCKYFIYCSGGCRMEALYHTEKIDGLDPWTLIENNTSLGLLLEKELNQNISLNENDFLKLNPTLKIREDISGVILSTKSSKEYFITEDVKILLEYFQYKKKCQIKDLIKKFELTQKDLIFLNKLIRNKIVILQKGGEKYEQQETRS